MSDNHVLVLAGGLSHEREVSLRSGSRLAGALRQSGFEVSLRDADGELLDWISAHGPDAAVVALHGGRGENGSVQAALEMVGVPFVGSGSPSCRLAWDKATAKALVGRAGHSTPPWVTLSHDAFRDLGAAALLTAVGARLEFPLVIKPDMGGSALGVQVVADAASLPSALVGSFAYGDVLVIERCVVGTEVAVTVIDGSDGPVALPAVEVVPRDGMFDYEARYTAGMTTYHTPARLTPEVAGAVGVLAVDAHRALGLRDVSRTDAIVTSDGRAHFLEANVSPGLTETSLLPMAVQASGDSLGDVYADLIGRAIRRGGEAR